MKYIKTNQIYFLIFSLSIAYHFYWLNEIGMGSVPGPVDPFLKTLQGFSLYQNHFSDQGLFYSFRNIDNNYEFCLFQKDIFTFRLGDTLLGPFPIALTSFVGFLFNFFSFQTVFKVFVFLNIFLYLCIFKNVKKSLALVLLIFWGLPFFIPNSEVSEHALLILLQISGFILLKISLYKYRNKLEIQNLLLILSGIVFGLGLFLRHEVLIFSNFIIATLIIVKLFGNRKNEISWRGVFYLSLGMYITFISFFLMNKLMYGSSVGPRLNTNNSGLYSDILSKLVFYKVILWREGPYYGLFGKNPLFLITVLLSILFVKRWSSLDKLMILPTLGLIVSVPLLAPNDGGSPWGARYLFLCIFPLVYMTGKILWWSRRWKSGKFFLFLQIIMIFSTIQSILYERKGLLASRLVAEQQRTYMRETAIENVDLIIFTSELVAMQTGSNYVNFPVVLVSHEKNLLSFQNKFLNQKDRFKEIALIEPKTSNLNLSKFSASDLEGIKPEKIIERFDRLLKKTSVTENNLTIIHRYRNE